jgi:glutathione peroxidase
MGTILNLALAAQAKSFFDFTASTIDGESVALSKYKGQVVLVVNTASGCGYTPQYKDLQALYAKYSEQGFVILGFPSNDFGSQEPGTNREIKKFCELNYKVTFPLFAKGPVSGAPAQPLFKWLTTAGGAAPRGEIQWNFEKFLIGRDGELKKRFKSEITPNDESVVSSIVAELKGK